MSRYKVGDKVLIRADLKAGECFHGFCVLESMINHKGKVLTVGRVKTPFIEVEECSSLFTEEMIVPHRKTNTVTVEVTSNMTDKLKALDGIKEALINLEKAVEVFNETEIEIKLS